MVALHITEILYAKLSGGKEMAPKKFLEIPEPVTGDPAMNSLKEKYNKVA